MEDGRFAIVKASYWTRRRVVVVPTEISFLGVLSLLSRESYVDGAM